MNSGTLLGKASISFSRPVYIQSCASVVGPKEGDGPLKNCFDMICDDPMFGEKKWEAAESAMQKEAAVLAIGKAGLTPDDIRFVFAGDLLAQTIASSFGIAEMGIPFFGLYGACSTMGESLSLGAIAVSAGYGITFSVHLQPFCHCRKRISFSSWLRLSAPSFRYLDCYRKRCLYSQSRGPSSIRNSRFFTSQKYPRICSDHRNHHRKSH